MRTLYLSYWSPGCLSNLSRAATNVDFEIQSRVNSCPCVFYLFNFLSLRLLSLCLTVSVSSFSLSHCLYICVLYRFIFLSQSVLCISLSDCVCVFFLFIVLSVFSVSAGSYMCLYLSFCLFSIRFSQHFTVP
jgi:hypothetical protein